VPIDEPTIPELLFDEFLQGTPPNKEVRIATPSFLCADGTNFPVGLAAPSIRLWCSDEKCGGERTFSPLRKQLSLMQPAWNNEFVEYVCRNCSNKKKTFALRLLVETNYVLVAAKYGETPVFAPHLPTRLRTLVGPDQDRFNKGLQSESLGLGIGAFSYYRQVVEEQKGRLLAEIAKVAQRLDAPKGLLDQLKAAEAETQFSTAVDAVKDALPEILQIEGRNPLVLLHSALSKGLHSGTDAECLQLAQSIRVVLAALAERISLALQDEKILKDAVANIANIANKPTNK
jgi:hypothetical protein